MSAIVSAERQLVLDGRGDGVEDVVAVVEVDRELTGRLGRLAGELLLRLGDLLEERLGGLEPAGDDLLGRRLRAVADELDGVLGRLGLDHHDRDVAALDHAAGDDHVEDGALELAVGRERDPLAVDQRDADAGDRAAERQAGEQHAARLRR